MHADLPVRVTPRSSRNKLVVEDDGSLRIWITASPTDGQANATTCAIIADALSIAKSRVFIFRGGTSRQKLVRIEGMAFDACMSALRKSVSDQ